MCTTHKSKFLKKLRFLILVFSIGVEFGYMNSQLNEGGAIAANG